MNTLYIEDDPNDAKLVALYIKTTGHSLTIAGNAQEARQAFGSDPDLILIDVLLGNAYEGYKLIREFRSQGYSRPVIAITGLSTSRDMANMHEAKFDHILNKPFEIDQLVEVIDQYTK